MFELMLGSCHFKDVVKDGCVSTILFLFLCNINIVFTIPNAHGPRFVSKERLSYCSYLVVFLVVSVKACFVMWFCFIFAVSIVSAESLSFVVATIVVAYIIDLIAAYQRGASAAILQFVAVKIGCHLLAIAFVSNPEMIYYN